MENRKKLFTDCVRVMMFSRLQYPADTDGILSVLRQESVTGRIAVTRLFKRVVRKDGYDTKSIWY